MSAARRDARLEHAHRLGAERDAEPARREAGRRRATTIGVLPRRLAKRERASTIASAVARPRTTSSSSITGGGLKKCRPTVRSGAPMRRADLGDRQATTCSTRGCARAGREELDLAEHLDLEVHRLSGAASMHEVDAVARRRAERRARATSIADHLAPGLVEHLALLHEPVGHRLDDADRLARRGPGRRRTGASRSPRRGRDLRDALPHRAGADDEHLADRGRGRREARVMAAPVAHVGRRRLGRASRLLRGGPGGSWRADAGCPRAAGGAPQPAAAGCAARRGAAGAAAATGARATAAAAACGASALVAAARRTMAAATKSARPSDGEPAGRARLVGGEHLRPARRRRRGRRGRRARRGRAEAVLMAARDAADSRRGVEGNRCDGQRRRPSRRCRRTGSRCEVKKTRTVPISARGPVRVKGTLRVSPLRRSVTSPRIGVARVAARRRGRSRPRSCPRAGRPASSVSSPVLVHVARGDGRLARPSRATRCAGPARR